VTEMNEMNEHKKGVKAMKYTAKPRNFVAKNAQTAGAGAHTDKKKAAIKDPRKAKHKKNLDTLDMVGEEFDGGGEYNDEAGMATGNLYSLARAVKGLHDTIGEDDNLPEWCQEKIAKAEMMLVGVWNYLQTQKDQGIDPQVAEGNPQHSHQYDTTMKHADNPTVQQRMAAHDIKPGVKGYRDRIDLLKDLERTGKLKKEPKKKNTSESWYYHRLNTILESKLK